MPRPIYTWDPAPYIIAACGCDEEDTKEIEEIILSRNGGDDVLDYYDPDKPGYFRRETRRAYDALEVLRTAKVDWPPKRRRATVRALSVWNVSYGTKTVEVAARDGAEATEVALAYFGFDPDFGFESGTALAIGIQCNKTDRTIIVGVR
jgi:hypothetical protein